jgi:hydrogenase expression/formation protein HypC
MCLAIPGQVVHIVDAERQLARVDVTGVQRTVNISLVDTEVTPITVGDWVLIHVGFAISRVDEAEASATLALLERMGTEYEQELAEYKASEIQ